MDDGLTTGALKAGLDEALGHITRGEYEVAVAVCSDLVARFPDSADAVHLCGYVHQLMGEHNAAIPLFRRVIELQPANAEAMNNLAASLKALAFLGEAEWVYRRAIEARPDFAIAHHNLAELLVLLDRPAEAAARARAAIEADPHLGETHRTLAIALDQQGRFDEAIAAFRQSALLGGNPAAARFGEGLIRLRRGEYVEGWDAYEARLSTPDSPVLHELFEYPRWRGANLARRTILVAREQGLGDEIMFASCLPDLLEVSGRCIVTCASRLRALFERSFPEVVFESGTQAELRDRLAGETVDFQIPAGSLPSVFRQREAEFPAREGYLHADPAKVGRWRERLRLLGAGPKVGLSWRGGLLRTGRSRRSFAPEQLSSAVRPAGGHLISLQYDVNEEEAQLLASRAVGITHWPEAFEDADETAALLCALDHCVTVCNTTVHLAGALGRPTSVLVPRVPEWRYGWLSPRMPWYSSVTLFRQETTGDWDPVVARVRGDLERRFVARTA